MPWMVIVFGLAVSPLGFVNVLLVVLQPVIFDAWCLALAVISIAMIGLAMDEMLARLQYMKRVKDSGVSIWRAFWGFKEVREKVA
jgi:hypothetical protein